MRRDEVPGYLTTLAKVAMDALGTDHTVHVAQWQDGSVSLTVSPATRYAAVAWRMAMGATQKPETLFNSETLAAQASAPEPSLP